MEQREMNPAPSSHVNNGTRKIIEPSQGRGGMKSQEHRRYVRLDTVFPVEFQILSKETKSAASSLQQGFTRNVSEGGICLEVNQLDNDFLNKISDKNNEVSLFINIPRREQPIEAKAEVRWTKKIKEDFPNKYLFGIEYTHIHDPVRKQIIGYARSLQRRPLLIGASIVLLVAVCAGLVWQVHNLGLKKAITEKQLLAMGEELIRAHEKRVSLENKIYTMNLKGRKLFSNLKDSKKNIKLLEKKLSKMSSVGTQISDELISQKMSLEGQMEYWQNERNTLLKQLNELTESKAGLDSELSKIKGVDDAKIVRVRLLNGNYILGQLLDLTSDRLDIKIGMGTIGIDRSMITGIKELSKLEKADIQKLWNEQEKEAQKDELEHKKFVEAKRKKGFTYYNGKWIKEDVLKKLKEEEKQKENEVFQLITQQTQKGGAKYGLLDKLIQKEGRPIISIKDNRVYLNGKLFFIKGVAYGIEYPGTNGSMDTFKHVPMGLFEKDFRMMKEAGINTIRTYEPLPEKLLDMAERNDIMVIENVCYPSGNTDFNSSIHLDVLKDQIEQYVNRDKDRKCILMWSIWNDAPWAWGSTGNVVQKNDFNKVNIFLRELYNTVKQCDISHPVTAANAMGISGEELGWDFLDVIGLNLYLGGYDWFLEKEAQKNIAEIKNIEEKYKKPVIILETGFSTFVKGQEQSDVLEKQIKIAGTNTSGVTVFQWADGWQKAGNKDVLDDHIEEHWGIVDGYRNPKAGYKTLCKLFNEIPTESMGYSEKSTN